MPFQQYIISGGNPYEIKFHGTIGSAKKSEITNFHPYAPAIKYVQHDKYNCCFISLESSLFEDR